jgi:hypothetical protein
MNAPPIPHKALKLSRKVDECKPLKLGKTAGLCQSGYSFQVVRNRVVGSPRRSQMKYRGSLSAQQCEKLGSLVGRACPTADCPSRLLRPSADTQRSRAENLSQIKPVSGVFD